MDSVSVDSPITQDPKKPSNAVEKTAELAKKYWTSPHDLMVHLTRRGKFESPETERNPVKHVLLFFHALGVGGGELVTCSLAKLWKSMDIDVTILTDVPIDENAPHQTLPQGVKHRVVPDYNTLTGDSYHQRAEALQRIIDETEADAMVFAHWFAESLPFDLVLCKENGLRTFVFVQSLFSLFFLDDVNPSLVEMPETYRLADGIISLSEADRAVWSAFNKHSYATSNPLSLPIPEQPARLEGHTIIWPARLHPDKYPERVIPIMQELVKLVPDAKLIMVGPVSHAYREQFVRMADIAGVCKYIDLLGEASPVDMQRFYNEADAFLLTSRREGWSLALAEALASGLPCVMYALPYLTLTQKNPAVIAVDQGDSRGAAKALANVLTDKHRALEMGRAGRARLREIATYDHRAFWDSVFNNPEGPSQNCRDDCRESYRSAIREAFVAHQQHCEAQRTANRSKDREIAKLAAEVARLGHNCGELQNALDRTTNSLSFKIGRAITGVPRKLRDALSRR